MEYVQDHERVWGTEHYPERPSLADILEAPVVVFWQVLSPENMQNRRMRVTLHDTLDDIEAYYTQLVFPDNFQPPEERIHRIWRNQKRVRISDVTIKFTFEDDETQSSP